MWKHLVLGVVGLSLLAVCGTSRADTTLRMKYKPGEVQKLKMTQKQTSSVQIAGQPEQKSQTTTVTDMETVCDEVDSAGVAKLRSRMSRMRMTMEMPAPLNKTLKYDTNDPAPTDPILAGMDKMMRPMIGQDMTMKSDSRAARFRTFPRKRSKV